MFNRSGTLKLSDGVDNLERWADNARHVQKNLLYKALFSITEGTVFHRYGVLQDARNPYEHFILVREDLVLKICYRHDGEGFGIRYIGPLEDAPGLAEVLDGLTGAP